MKANNSIVMQKKKPTFSMVINSQSKQTMIGRTLNDPRRAASFTASLISAVSSSPQLASCNPESIISAALSGEAMDLSLRLGQYSIVPYGDTANYQISYKGLSQLAIRSGLYKRLKVQDIREGEYLGEDPDTWEPIIRKITTGREKLPLAGIRALYELSNGFRNVVYWEHEKILDHADRYSAAFSKEKYMKMLNGEMSPEEVARLQKGSPWYGEPLSEQHLKMCRKTVLLQLLNDGVAPLSIDMRMAIDNDTAQERGGAVIFPEDPAVVEANQNIEQEVVAEEDVIEGTATVETVAEEKPEPPVQPKAAPKPASKPVQPKPVAQETAQNATRRTRMPQNQSEAASPKTVKGTTQKSLKNDSPQPGNLPLEEFMTPPVDTEGLPFA